MTTPNKSVSAWDAPIGNDGEDFKVFPSGTVVDFEITAFEKGTTVNGNPVAILKFAVVDSEGDSGTVKDDLVLTPKSEWKTCSFFVCIGQRKRGETMKPDWNKVLGSTGRAQLGIRKFQGRDGEVTVNTITKFLEPSKS